MAQAKLFGTARRAIQVTNGGAEEWVPVDPECCRVLAGVLDNASGKDLQGRVYLRLESIHGDHSTVLNVYLGLPNGAVPLDHPEHLAGAAGLFGVRQASRERGRKETADGLACSLDVTQVFKNLRLAGPPDPASIRVNIVPYRPMPENARISVGTISFFFLPPG